MKESKNHVLACGACSVVIDENDHVVTSIDVLVNGVKNIVSKITRRGSSRKSSAVSQA